MPTRAYIGLGSNVGDRAATCRRAVELLGRAGTVTQVSSFYCTEPVGDQAQDDFVNAVVELETDLDPLGLLSACQAIENELGRVRERRWGPRTIDLDILLYGDRVVSEDRITVPHPFLPMRRFVLVPLAEIAPEVVHPLSGKTVKELLEGLDDPHRVEACDL